VFFKAYLEKNTSLYEYSLKATLLFLAIFMGCFKIIIHFILII